MIELTVIMPVFNGETYLKDAINSILNQTYTNFEFLIIDDGSTDSTANIVNSFKDPRIKYIQNKNNKGLIYSSNLGNSICKTPYIAFMDADDVSHPTRLEKQITFLKENMKINICSCSYKFIGKRNTIIRLPLHHSEIKAKLLWGCSLLKGALMYKKETLNSLHYSDNYLHAEDYGMYIHLLESHTSANLDEILYYYRIENNNISIKFRDIQLQTHHKIRKQLLDKLDVQYTEKESLIYHNVAESNYTQSLSDLILLKKLFDNLIFQNRKINYFNQQILLTELAKKFFWSCFYSSYNGKSVIELFKKSGFKQHLNISRKYFIEFYLRALLKIRK